MHATLSMDDFEWWRGLVWSSFTGCFHYNAQAHCSYIAWCVGQVICCIAVLVCHRLWVGLYQWMRYATATTCNLCNGIWGILAYPYTSCICVKLLYPQGSNYLYLCLHTTTTCLKDFCSRLPKMGTETSNLFLINLASVLQDYHEFT